MHRRRVLNLARPAPRCESALDMVRLATWVFAAAALLGASALGCGGDQEWRSDMSWQGQDGPMATAEPTSRDAHILPPSGDAQTTPLTWFGVRHDLTMATSAPRSAVCSCLAAEVGMPGKQAFVWDGSVPTIGSDALVVAVSARGVACAAVPDETKRRASISAVDRDGADVIVEIEELPEGRPLALGAIIPKPDPGGSVYVRGRSPKIPYAQAMQGQKCRVMGPISAAPLPPPR